MTPVPNIDIVAYERDQTVLLARTHSEFSIGIIRFPNGLSFPRINRGEFLVAHLPQEIDTSRHTGNTTIEVSGPMDLEQAHVFTIGRILEWLGISGDEKLEFHTYEKDARPNQSRFQRLDGPIPDRNEQIGKKELIERVKRVGLDVPIDHIINTVRESLSQHN